MRGTGWGPDHPAACLERQRPYLDAIPLKLRLTAGLRIERRHEEHLPVPLGAPRQPLAL